MKCTIIIPKLKSYKSKTKKSLVIMEPTRNIMTQIDSTKITISIWEDRQGQKVYNNTAARSASTLFVIPSQYYTSTVLPAKSDSEVMFCLQGYQGLRINRSLVY